MPSNYTPNYSLNQWEPDDRVLRTDFNADNLKIDAALGELSRLRQAVGNLAFQVGQLTLVDTFTRRKAIHCHSVYSGLYLEGLNFTFTGGAKTANSKLILSGTGTKGSAASTAYFFDKPPQGSRIRMWVHYKGGSVTPSINGNALTPVETYPDFSILGEYITCTEYVLDCPLGNTYEIRLDLNCGSDSAMEVHDYVVVFL